MTTSELIQALREFDPSTIVNIVVPRITEEDTSNTARVDICYVSDWELSDDSCGGPLIQPAYSKRLEELRVKGVWK